MLKNRIFTFDVSGGYHETLSFIVFNLFAVLLCVNSYAEFPHQFLFGHTGRALAVAFSLDGKWLASGGANEILVWEIGVDEPMYSLTGHTGKIEDLAFRSDGNLVSASLDGTIRLWNIREQQEIRAFEGHAGQVTSVDLNADGSRLVSGSRDRTLKLWAADTGESLLTLEGHTDVVWSVAFSPDGSIIAPDQRMARCVFGMPLMVCNFIAWMDIHKVCFLLRSIRMAIFIASGARDGTVRLWNINPVAPGGTHGETEPFATYDRQIMSVRFNPNGRLLAIGLLNSPLDNTLKLWDVSAHSELQSFDTQIIHDLSFSPTRPQLVSRRGSRGSDHISGIQVI